MVYAVLPGGDQPLIDLVAITPQPRCSGLRYTRTSYTAAGGMNLDGPYAVLEWDVIEDATDYDTLLTQFGLDLGTSEAVTITLPNELFAATRYNGVALRPVAGETANRSDFFIRDVSIIIRNLTVAP